MALGGTAALPAACMVVGLSAAYALGIMPAWRLAGDASFVLVLVPAAVAGWLFGPVSGGLVSAALTALNAGLFATLIMPDAGSAVLAAGAVPAAMMTLAVGIGTGVSHRRQLTLRTIRAVLQRQLEERDALTASLRASERRFRLLAEESLAGVYLIQDGLFRYVNPAFAAAIGYRPEEIVDRLGPEDLTLPEDRPIVRASLEDRLAKGSASARYRLRAQTKDGRVLHLEVMGRALSVDGAPAILGTLLDRTREAEDEARNRIGMTALEVAPAGIVVTDEEGTIVWANPRVETMSGYSRNELIGTSASLFIDGDEPQGDCPGLWRTIQAGGTWHGRLASRRKGGGEYVNELAVSPVGGGDASTPRSFVATMMDVTESVRAKERIEELNENLLQRISELETLHGIDTVITDGAGLDAGLPAYVAAVRRGSGLDAVSVFLLSDDGEHLELRATSGYRSPTPEHLVVSLEVGIAGAAAGRGETIVMQGRQAILDAIEPEKRAVLAPEEFELFAAVPMISRGELRGVLHVGHRGTIEADEAWRRRLKELAVQGAILVDHANLLSDLRQRNEELRVTYDATIEGWSRTLDLRDKETEGHSRRVTEVSLALARALGLEDGALLNVRRGALLHDIGKMGVPDAILQKPGPLTEEEWSLMRRHTTYARDLLSPIPFLRPALEIPYSHHERWDGSGYPEGLRGEAIPLAARVFAVADVYDALTSDRPYRAAWTRERALHHIRDQAGSHFDPAVVDAFLQLMCDPPPVLAAPGEWAAGALLGDAS